MSTLTITELDYLSELRTLILRGARVRWAGHGDYSTIAHGVARNFTDADGNHWHNASGDVRDAYVWISATMEHFLPVRDVLDLMRRGLFAEDSR